MESSRLHFFNARLISNSVFGIILPFAGFLLLASHVWNQGKGFVWDIPMLQWVHQTARPLLDAIAQSVTPLGIAWGTVPVLTVLGAILVYQQHWRSLLYLIVTPVGSFLLNRTLKLYFHRERPHLWEVFAPDLSFAFPSGHAMASLSFAIVVIVLAWNTRWRWLVFTLASLFVLTIGWTRIYLGMHYPSDVVAGWLLAIAWSITTLLLIQPYQSAENGTKPE